MAEEATVNPDGSTTFENEDPTGGAGEGFQDTFSGEETLKQELTQGIDPAIWFVLGLVVLGLIYFFFFRSKEDEGENDEFFSNFDGEKVCLAHAYVMLAAFCLLYLGGLTLRSFHCFLSTVQYQNSR